MPAFPKVIAGILIDASDRRPCAMLLDADAKIDLSQLIRDTLTCEGIPRPIVDDWSMYDIAGNKIIAVQDLYDMAVPFALLIASSELHSLPTLVGNVKKNFVLPAKNANTSSAWFFGEEVMERKAMSQKPLKSILKKPKEPQKRQQPHYEKHTKNTLVRTAVKPIKHDEFFSNKKTKEAKKKKNDKKAKSLISRSISNPDGDGADVQNQADSQNVDKQPEEPEKKPVQRRHSEGFLLEGEPFFLKMGQSKPVAKPLGRNSDFFAKMRAPIRSREDQIVVKRDKDWKPSSAVRSWVVSAGPTRSGTVQPAPATMQPQMPKPKQPAKRSLSAATFTVTGTKAAGSTNGSKISEDTDQQQEPPEPLINVEHADNTQVQDL